MSVSFVGSTPFKLCRDSYRSNVFQCVKCNLKGHSKWTCARERESSTSPLNRGVQRIRSLAKSIKKQTESNQGVRVEEIAVDAVDVEEDVPFDILKTVAGSDTAVEVRTYVVQEVTEILEKAKMLLEENNNTQEGLEALVELLEMARYHPLTVEDVRRGATLEGCADQLPVFISPRGFDSSFLDKGFTSRNIMGVPKDYIAFYPSIMIVWKGVGLQRKQGLQLQAKLRALEAKYFGWIEFPFDWIISHIASMGFGRGHDVKNDKKVLEIQNKLPKTTMKKTIQRTSPSRQLELKFEDVLKVFLPIRTQEPTYHSLCVIYRKSPENSIQKINEAVATCRSLSGAQAQDNNKSAIGITDHANEPVRVDVMSDVPWAALNNFLPGRYLSFVTMDIIRFDIITIIGLFAAATTYIQDFGRFYVGFTLLASLVYYGSRIVFSIRSALDSYHKKITSDILRALVGRGRGGLLALADEAVKVRFTEACLMLSSIYSCESPQDAAIHASRNLRDRYQLDFTFVDNGKGAFRSLQKYGLVTSQHRSTLPTGYLSKQGG